MLGWAIGQLRIGLVWGVHGYDESNVDKLLGTASQVFLTVYHSSSQLVVSKEVNLIVCLIIKGVVKLRFDLG